MNRWGTGRVRGYCSNATIAGWCTRSLFLLVNGNSSRATVSSATTVRVKEHGFELVLNKILQY